MIAGIFIERHQIVVAIGRNNPRLKPSVEFTDRRSFQIDKETSPASVLDEIARYVLEKTDSSVTRVGIGAYGPFQTLGRGARATKNWLDYGATASSADPPFSNCPLVKLLSEGFAKHAIKSGPTPEIIVNTDANTAALAEAYFREAKGDEITAYLLVTHRIGGGFVRGQQVYETAWHAEVGMLLGSPLPADPLKLSYSGEVQPTFSDLASVPALIERARRLGSLDPKALPSSAAIPLEAWRLQAAYLAQLCYTVTVVTAPTRIIIDSPLVTFDDALIKDINKRFRQMLIGRVSGPMIRYKALDHKAFISAPRTEQSAYAGPVIMASLERPFASVSSVLGRL